MSVKSLVIIIVSSVRTYVRPQKSKFNFSMTYLNPNRTEVLLCYQKHHLSIPASHSPLTCSWDFGTLGLQKWSKVVQSGPKWFKVGLWD